MTWQQLTEQTPSGIDLQAGNLTAAAAVVTSRRVLIVGPDLALQAATPQSTDGAVITSALWVGPALLFCTTAGAVRLPAVHLSTPLSCVRTQAHCQLSEEASHVLHKSSCCGDTVHLLDKQVFLLWGAAYMGSSTLLRLVHRCAYPAWRSIRCSVDIPQHCQWLRCLSS